MSLTIPVRGAFVPASAAPADSHLTRDNRHVPAPQRTARIEDDIWDPAEARAKSRRGIPRRPDARRHPALHRSVIRSPPQGLRHLVNDEEVQAQVLPPPGISIDPPDQDLDLGLGRGDDLGRELV